MGSTLAPKTAENADANAEYADPVGPIAPAPLPPEITADSLADARDPEAVEKAREAAAEERGDDAEPEVPARVSGEYHKAHADVLEAEIDARRAEGREITVTGTGRDGGVVKGDQIKALEADDKAKASA